MSYYQVNRRNRFLFLLIIAGLSSCAQSRSAKSTKSENTINAVDTIANKAVAFYIVKMPGNIPVSQEGEELPGSRGHKYYTIYIETLEENIKWEKVIREEEFFTISASLIKETEFEVGKDIINQDPVIIKRSTGKYLWKLELEAINEGKNGAITKKEKGFLLTWSINGKLFEKSIAPPVELYTQPSV